MGFPNDDYLKFIKVCWDNIQYQREILIDEADWNLLYKIAKKQGWK